LPLPRLLSDGAKVHPQQIEAVLAATPGVRAACVFAVPDERWGHIVGAALTVAPTSTSPPPPSYRTPRCSTATDCWAAYRCE
jgi:acyl-CoA synthetase (AMP-forming)/AMP-acid ligase II